MKKIVGIFAFLAIVACEQNKIAYVDNVKLMDEYQEKVEVQAKFQAKLEVLNKKRDSLSQAFQIELQAFQAKAQGMNPKKAQEEYQVFQQKGQFMGQQLQQEEQTIQKAGQVEMDSIISKVKGEIKEFGKVNGYTYILSGGDGGSVLYGADTQDLTTEILKNLNDKYKK